MKKFLLIFTFFFSLNSFSQKEANFWYFGFNAGLNFTDCNPVALADGQLNTYEGCSTISNSDGELRFYSDGTTVWDKNHNIMQNGTGLFGDSSSAQSALVVPNPENSNIYYLFVVSNANNPGFYYYTIDLEENGGLGSVIAGPVDLNNGQRNNWTERVTAIQSDKSNEFWVISASLTTIYSYYVTKDGVSTTPVTSNTGSTDATSRGSLKVSPDGNKLVITDQESNCLLFDFNTERGTANNKQILNVNNSYGAEFSQLGNRLYISTGGNNQGRFSDPGDSYIYQFDLTKTSITGINSSREIINLWENGFRGALQLGPDARIYYAKSGESSLGVINNPEELGGAVNYVHEGISLGAKTSSEGLPPFIQSFFKSALTDIDTGIRISGDFLVCRGETKRLGINSIMDFDDSADTTKPITYSWYRDNDLLDNETTSIITVGNPPRDVSGTYLLKATYFNNCGRERTLEAVAEIIFGNKPTINNIDVYEQCDFDTNPNDFITNFNLTIKESELYTETENVNIDFFETSDTSFSSPIAKENYRNSIATSAANGRHKLIVRITNIDTGCNQTKEIELNVNPSGVSDYPDVYTCELDSNASNPDSINSIGSGDAFFDFDIKTQEIIANSSGALSLATHNFNYFRTTEDATLQNNEIALPFEDHLFVDGDDVFVRISLSGSDACESIGQFKIRIQEIPIPQGNTNILTLCLNNPIDNPQQITVDLNADTGLNTDTYKWYLNNQIISGETNAILEANKGGTYKVEALRAYTNEPTDTSDDFTCVGFNTFTVLESNVALIESINFIDDQDDVNENTLTITVSGEGNYEYALNSNNISEFNKGNENLSYTFTNVQAGLNKVYIRDVNECGQTSSQEISFIYFQRHFSPNQDGKFDTWKVLGTDNSFYNEVSIQIFDRFGKLLKVVDQKNENGWNGFYNGKLLPSNDYWYNATLIDITGASRTKTGHFSLVK